MLNKPESDFYIYLGRQTQNLSYPKGNDIHRNTQKWLVPQNKSFFLHCTVYLPFFLFYFVTASLLWNSGYRRLQSTFLSLPSELTSTEILPKSDTSKASDSWRNKETVLLSSCSSSGSTFEQLYPFCPSAVQFQCQWFLFHGSGTSFRPLVRGFSLSRHHPSKEAVSVLLDADYNILFLLFSKN